MSKVSFEFDGLEERYDVALCTHRVELAVMLEEISDYARQLRKYEERKEIPTEEVERKLTDMLYRWHMLRDCE